MNKLRILYVDDEADIREVACLALELDPDIEVRAVESGPAAVALLQEGAWEPTTILLDLMMPVLDGPATLAALRGFPGHATTPVIFITARAQESEQRRLLGLGAAGVITKPFDPMTLASQVRALLLQTAA